MTPAENRRRLRELRTVEDSGRRENFHASKQPLHNSAEALWIKAMNEGGSGSQKPRRSRIGRLA